MRDVDVEAAGWLSSPLYDVLGAGEEAGEKDFDEAAISFVVGAKGGKEDLIRRTSFFVSTLRGTAGNLTGLTWRLEKSSEVWRAVLALPRRQLPAVAPLVTRANTASIPRNGSKIVSPCYNRWTA